MCSNSVIRCLNFDFRWQTPCTGVAKCSSWTLPSNKSQETRWTPKGWTCPMVCQFPAGELAGQVCPTLAMIWMRRWHLGLSPASATAPSTSTHLKHVSHFDYANYIASSSTDPCIYLGKFHSYSNLNIVCNYFTLLTEFAIQNFEFSFCR